jgi:hypothetical protein
MIDDNLENRIRKMKKEVIERIEIKTKEEFIQTSLNGLQKIMTIEEAASYVKRNPVPNDVTNLVNGVFWYFNNNRSKSKDLLNKIDDVDIATSDLVFFSHGSSLFVWHDLLGAKQVRNREYNIISLEFLDRELYEQVFHQGILRSRDNKFIINNASNIFDGPGMFYRWNDELVGIYTDKLVNILTNKVIAKPDIVFKDYNKFGTGDTFPSGNTIYAFTKKGIYDLISQKKLVESAKGGILSGIFYNNDVYYSELIDGFKGSSDNQIFPLLSPGTKGYRPKLYCKPSYRSYIIKNGNGHESGLRTKPTKFFVHKNILYDNGGLDDWKSTAYPNVVETINGIPHNLAVINSVTNGRNFLYTDHNYDVVRYDVKNQKREIIVSSDDLKQNDGYTFAQIFLKAVPLSEFRGSNE